MIPACIRRRIGETFMAGCLVIGMFAQSEAQPEQRIDVTIKDFTFVTKQIPLRLGVPTVISIRNVDPERHDFGSSMFDGVPTRIDTAGVITYGTGIGGVFLDAQREAVIQFTLDRAGRHEFRCSIHPDMKGELLLVRLVGIHTLGDDSVHWGISWVVPSRWRVCRAKVHEPVPRAEI